MKMFGSKGDIKLFVNKKDEIFVQVGSGSLFKITNSVKSYKDIKTTDNCTIKFHITGIYGLSVWKNKKQVKDDIWSMVEAKKIIQELN